MRNFDDSPGGVLRWLRRRRSLTLERAARLLHTSAPVLSRKERGAAPVEREDVQMIISAFRLDAWESFQLVTSAGYIPAAFHASGSKIDIQVFADTLLPHLAFPALIADDLLYIYAWNEGARVVLSLPNDSAAPVHPISQLFSPQWREQLGAAWQPYADRTLRIFHQRTLLVRRRPDYRRLLDEFAAAHGPLFVQRWEAAQSGYGEAYDRLKTSVGLQQDQVDSQASLESMETILHSYDTAKGEIEFLLTRATWHFTQSYELNVYVPYRQENSARYNALLATLEIGHVYYGVAPEE